MKTLHRMGLTANRCMNRGLFRILKPTDTFECTSRIKYQQFFGITGAYTRSNIESERTMHETSSPLGRSY